MSTYLEAQLGFAEESTFGTRVAPTRFLPFNDESLTNAIEYLESKAYRAGRTTQTTRRPSKEAVTGDVNMELAPQGLGLLLKHAFGSVVTAGAGPYTHTFTPGALNGKSLSVQIGRTDEGGTMRPFDYSGVKIPEWELDGKVGELAMIKFTLDGIVEDTSQTLAVASYPAGLDPFSWTEMSLTVAGTEIKLRGVTLKGSNGLITGRHRISATTPSRAREQKQGSIREFTGTLDADFEDLTAYDRFINQTQAALVLTLDNGTESLVITMSVEFDGETPKASGIGNEPEQSLPFIGINATDDASVITAVLTNSDATP